MAINRLIGLSEPPLQTPPLVGNGDMHGIPFEHRDDPQLGTFGVAWAAFFNQVYQKLSVGAVIRGTKIDMIGGLVSGVLKPSQFPAERYLGNLFFQTDTLLVYLSNLVQTGGAVPVPTWVYFGGEQSVLQAAIPATLGVNDTGLSLFVSDFWHRLKWSGAAWGWAPGENGSGFIDAFLVDPSPLTGWALCDGSAGVTYLKANGTIGSLTLPNLTGTPSYLKLGGSAAAAINPAVRPTFTETNLRAANAVTGITAVTGAASGTNTVASGTGATVASSTHTHAVSITDPGHVHTISKTANPNGLDGEPSNVVLRPFFRR
jgi:hypothetical protein